jgi:hypothetical protein
MQQRLGAIHGIELGNIYAYSGSIDYHRDIKVSAVHRRVDVDVLVMHRIWISTGGSFSCCISMIPRR